MHPVHDALNTFAYIPEDLFLLILSFLPYGEIPHLTLLGDSCFAASQEFYMRKPKPMFEASIWTHRVAVRPNIGTVLYGMDILRTNHDQPNPFTTAVYALFIRTFNRYLTISGHCQCEIAFHKLLTDRETSLTESEQNFILQHYESDWIPKFHQILADTTIQVIQVEALDYMILYSALCLLINTELEELAMVIATFLLDCGHYPRLVESFRRRTCNPVLTRILYVLNVTHNAELADALVYLQSTYLEETAYA
jgi:hypothetical protein